MLDHWHISSKKIAYSFNECVKMTKELYFADTLISKCKIQ